MKKMVVLLIIFAGFFAFTSSVWAWGKKDCPQGQSWNKSQKGCVSADFNADADAGINSRGLNTSTSVDSGINTQNNSLGTSASAADHTGGSGSSNTATGVSVSGSGNTATR